MNEIESQVNRARRRMNFAGLLTVLPAWLLPGLVIAVIGWSIPKIFPLAGTSTDAAEWGWQMFWLAGSVLAALVVAGVIYWHRRVSHESASVEIDRRFTLKERISSAFGLKPDQVNDPAGQCLVTDATSRANRIDLRDGFPLRLSRSVLWLMVPIAMLAVLSFVPRAKQREVLPVQQASLENPEIRTAIENAKKQLEEKKKQLSEMGLKDLAGEMDSLGRKLDELESGKSDLKKEALIKLNDLKDLLKEQQNAMGNPEDLKKTLGQLNDLKSAASKELNDALKKGDFEQANNAIQNVLEKLKKGEMSGAEMQQIAKDLEGMAQELKKLAENHEQKKEDLQNELKQAVKDGDLQKAADLKEQLEKMEQQKEQMQKLQDLAQKLGKCAECMKPGNANGGKQPGQPQDGGNKEGQQQAMQALEDLMEQMEQMDLDQKSMEALQNLEQDLQECKDQINGCQGEGIGDKPNWSDWAKGEGKGGGKRESEEGDTGEYKTQVRGLLQKGQTVVTGDADGENVAGPTISQTRELIQSSMSRDKDPIEDQQLQRWQRQHALEYFQKLRDGS